MDKKQWLRQLMNAVGDLLGSDLTYSGEGLGGSMAYQGIPLKIKRNMGSKNTPPSLDIMLSLPFPCPLIIRNEVALDRLGKAMGLAHETQSGDLAFDEKYYVECEHPSFAGPFLTAGNHRNIARRLIEEIPHASVVSGDHDGVKLKISPFKEDQFNETHLVRALPLLNQFGSEIPQMPPFPRRINPGILLCIFDSLILAAGLITFLIGMKRYLTLDSMFIYSLRYSIPAFIAFLALSFLILRGRTGAVYFFLLITLCSIFSFVFLSWGGTLFINGYFDNSDPVKNVTSVMSKSLSKGSKSTTYRVSLTSWRKKSGYENIEVGAGWYNNLKPGDRLRIVTREGRLDFEWIVSWEKETSS